MSVKRYDRQEIYDVTYRAAGDECLPEPSENGEFVLHSDYARFHSLFANSEQENARLKAEVERLKAEGDRLKEAGDEMAFHIGNDEESQRKCADRWFDLREGKQS